MAKILIIEDEAGIRENLSELLKIEGYDVMGASDGITGIMGAMEYQPDLILCDVIMPETTGFDVLRALRQEPAPALVPFIFLTAFADKENIQQGIALGADGYLTKPFACAEVLKAVEMRLKKQILITAEQRALQSQLMLKQQEAQQFRERLDDKGVDLIRDIRSQIKGNLTTLQLIRESLQKLPKNAEISHSLGLVKRICASEVKMLARIPNLEQIEHSD